MVEGHVRAWDGHPFMMKMADIIIMTLIKPPLNIGVQMDISGERFLKWVVSAVTAAALSTR